MAKIPAYNQNNMIRWLLHLIGIAQGKEPLGIHRSPLWPKARALWLKDHPACAVCQGTSEVEVHHVIPFHEDPTLELFPENFITLCESGGGGVNCHLHFGHLGSYRSYNPEVKEDARTWAEKIKGRT